MNRRNFGARLLAVPLALLMATVSRVMARRSRAGTLGFALASALVGAAVVSFAIAGPHGDAPPKQRPAGEVKAGLPNVPAATTPLTVAEIGSGRDIARMRVLPPGSVPSYNWQARQGTDETRAGFEDSAPEVASLSRHIVQPLPGFVVSHSGFDVAVAKGGSRRPLQEFYTLTSPDQWPIEIEVIALAPAGTPDIIMFSEEAGRTTSLHSHRNVGAVLV